MNIKKSELYSVDKELFQNAMKDVTPIQNDTHVPHVPQKIALSIHKKMIVHSGEDFRFMGEMLLDNISDDQWLSSDNTMHFTHGVISRRVLKELKNGEIAIDVKLDLHGFTGDEAIQALTNCMSKSQTTGKRVLLVIHGKSQTPNKQGPILKNIVHQWLRKQSEVLAVQSAHTRHGGHGATYVLLRRKR